MRYFLLLFFLFLLPFSFAVDYVEVSLDDVGTTENLTQSEQEDYVFTISETEEFSIDLEVEDPDGDSVDIWFSEPLSEDGFWLTTYDDAGEYSATAYLSDGEDIVELPITLIVENVNRPLQEVQLTADSTEVYENGAQVLYLTATDPDRGEVEVTWYVDGEVAESESYEPVVGSLYESTFSYEPGFEDAGSHTIEALVSDGEDSVTTSLDVVVMNVNRRPYVEVLEQYTVDEGASLSLNLFTDDPDGDVVDVFYGRPLSEAGVWDPGFEDAGDYVIPLTITDGDAILEVEANISVKNVNRLPTISALESAYVLEDGSIQFDVITEDLDGQELSVSVDGAPEGASFDGESFSYSPTFDAVSREENSLQYSLLFTVTDGQDSVTHTTLLTVDHKNRPPAFDPYSEWGNEITVDEGQELILKPRYADPDGDPITVTFSGWMDTKKKHLSYVDAGKYSVIVTISDGEFARDQKLKIHVNNVNDAPKLKDIPILRVREGETIEHVLRYADRDPVSFSLKDLPAQVQMDGDVLRWTPTTDTVENLEDTRGKFTRFLETFVFWRPTGAYKEYQGVVTATDALGLESAKIIYLRVYENDLPPQIVGQSPRADTIVALEGDIIAFNVEAVDESSLEYTWDFGFFDKHKGGNNHRRKFTKLGKHDVGVTISDGKKEVHRTWTIEVVPFTPPQAEEPIALEEEEEAPVEDTVPSGPRVVTFAVD